MIIYRTQERPEEVSARIDRIGASLAKLRASGRHEDAVEALVELGELEAAVSDRLCPDEDTVSPHLETLGDAARLAGKIFRRSWDGEREGIASAASELSTLLDRIRAIPLPSRIRFGIPEGYAYYGLFPETYLEAAKRFFDAAHPESVFCIGIRSIGCSLSAAVSARLTSLGCTVRSITIRPRGHPFDRRPAISKPLKRWIASSFGSFFAVIDEGPGLSGSSLCGTARFLSELGIDDERIVFFPSWEPDGSGFASEEARARWPLHRKFTASFEDVRMKNGRFSRNLPGRIVRDVSGGMWRSLHFSDAGSGPPVHPHHERRKYLCSRRGGADRLFLAKFAGLGRYGRETHERAEFLSKAGFHPRVDRLTGGFIEMELLAGRPLSRRDAGARWMERIAGYLAFLRTNARVAAATPMKEILAMIRVNIGEAPGLAANVQFSGIERAAERAAGGDPVAVDGRMLPHEWIETGDYIFKVDSTDHYRDHFFPGCTDIAWDLAGCTFELALDRGRKNLLIERYSRLSGDTDTGRRLPFFSIAYLSFRLGYSKMAADMLGDSPDGNKFRRLQKYYASRLLLEIRRLA